MKDSALRTAEQLGRAIRLRRMERDLSQKAVAEQIGVGRKWIIHFEAGNPKAELSLVLKLLDALDLQASLGEKRSASDSTGGAATSTLEEVFNQLQRPGK